MPGVDAKGRTTIVDGESQDNEVNVINGAIKVKLVPRGTPREGYGSAQLKGGVASLGEAEIVDGAIKVRFV